MSRGLDACTLKRDHRARPQHITSIEAIRRSPPRIVGGKLAAAAVEFELEQFSIAVVDAPVAIPVVLDACQAQLECEARIGGRVWTEPADDGSLFALAIPCRRSMDLVIDERAGVRV